MSDELKPCPFCGEKPFTCFYVDGEGVVYIQCGNCGATQDALVYEVGDPAESRLAEAEAVAAWNMRAKVD